MVVCFLNNVRKLPELTVIIPGGNSFNEALQYGIPQLVCSQWFDTIDYAVAARSSGIGLSSEHPGRISGRDVSDKISRLLTERSFTDKTLLWSLKSRAAGGSGAAA
jgi:UDP:flavonoid glycosyltransferase YjiC (YdhE family)